MSREERQGLIHEGSGTVMSAYVEIVFDNSDGRFPINRPQISIRRTIGLKKDDYALDGKTATRSDIMNLLESAGFSRSNPYYIVPQGKITSLTNSKDAERLTLLKEVSGATVFERKLKESTKEMENSNYKKERIDEALRSIDERLSDLQIESADLKQFQTLEKTKKIYEYNLFDREFESLNLSIESIENKYDAILQKSQLDLQELENRESLFQELNEQINELKIQLHVSKLEKEQADLDYNQMIKIIADKQVLFNEYKSSMEDNREKAADLKSQIEQYSNLVKENEQKIKQLKPDLQELQVEESELKNKLSDLVSKQRALYSKQSRFLKFTSKKERDTWLNQEISTIKKTVQAKDSEIKQVSLEVKSFENILDGLTNKVTTLNTSINDETRAEQIGELNSTILSLKSKMNVLSDDRKVLWRDEIKLKSIQDSLTNDYNNVSNLVNQTMTRSQAQGLAAVKSITTKLNLDNNVYGPLAELFTVNDKYKVSTEVVAGNSLFHVVVDTDSTASMIMEELNRHKLGRVTFIPLNRVEVPSIEYPDSSVHQCIPLIKRLKYDAKIENAIKQVFGKTIVVSDLHSGSELARAYKLTAITLDGDRADTKGALTGGYRDYKKSRIDALRLQSKKKTQLMKVGEDLDKCTQEIEKVNQELTDLHNELQLNIRDLDRFQSSQEPTRVEISQLTSKKYHLQKEHESLSVKLSSITAFRKNLLVNLKEHEKELNSEFSQSLLTDEVSQLESLNQEIIHVEKQLDEVVTKSSELEMEVSSYESEMVNNYQANLAKLSRQQETISIFRGTTSKFSEKDIQELERELEDLAIKLDTIESRATSANNEFTKLSQEISKCENSLKKSNDQQMKIIKNLESFSTNSETMLNRKAIMVKRREDVQKSIRDLGVLPEEAFNQEKYSKDSSDGLLNKLNKVNEDLGKYSHINKKALEQYNTFTKQHDELIGRRKELDSSCESIELLIANLQMQKEQAIKQSFKKVAHSFHEIFSKLVPLGTGNLVMQTKVSDDNDDNTQDIQLDEDEEINETSIENYVGVSIQVSFNSKHDEQQRIEQLSGGQKSLCAIALILAIQECDPAPFYLLDEIDANLDTQYRTAVALMISTLSKNAQFICTTFRPEMLKVADKFYGVMFSNKVSTISEIDREHAIGFVEGQQPR
jgi:structural maintenance of chromosome 3 (chondroitin sulfate proteoglycan 6)